MAAPTPASASPFGTRRRVVLLGATGSVGRSALRVIAAQKNRLKLIGIAARSDWRRLAEVAREFSVKEAAIYDAGAFEEARQSGAFPMGTRLLKGPEGLREIAALPEADVVLVAVVGTAGLEPAF